MEGYKIIREELVKQKYAKGVFSEKEFKTISDEVVGKFCIMVRSESGFIGVGVHANREEALSIAKSKINFEKAVSEKVDLSYADLKNAYLKYIDFPYVGFQK